VEISSSNFPRFDRNLNTGGSLADEKVSRKALETVYHGKKYASRIVLPVIPELQAAAATRYVPNSTIAKGVSVQAR
jgi:hypothetical protein